MAQQYTIDGSTRIEQRIHDDMACIRAAVLQAVGPKNLTALVLGGGYGRGEGGICCVNGEERPYNDYDFFVVVPFTSRSRRRFVVQQLQALRHDLEPRCGIHVDFSPPMPLSRLSTYPQELMFLEAKRGHRVIYGPEGVFDALPDYDEKNIPLEEGTRLLMNRGVGLWMALDLLDQGEPANQAEYEFVVRNLYKALMAMGDVVLFLNHVYRVSYQKRWEQFVALETGDLPRPEQVRAGYRASLDFKFHPDHTLPSGKDLRSWLEEVCSVYAEVFLWFERKRLQVPNMDWMAYSNRSRRLAFVSLNELVRNVIRNGRCGTWKIRPLTGWTLHPRDNILKLLSSLLFAHERNSLKGQVMLRLWEQCG